MRSNLARAVFASLGDGRLAALLRRRGSGVLDRLIATMRPDERAALERQVDALRARNVRAMLLGDADYPTRLSAAPQAPTALFYRGPIRVLERPALAICGAAIDPDDGALVAAEAAARIAVDAGLTVLAGDDRGVGGSALWAAVRHGGDAAVLLADGIRRVWGGSGDPHGWGGSARVLALSPLLPEQPWSVGATVTCNATVAALCTALVAVAPGPNGATLDAGQRALAAGRPVLAVGDTHGSRLLVDHGATPARDRIELAWWLDRLVSGARRTEPRGGPHQRGLYGYESRWCQPDHQLAPFAG
jgi:DNA processing protein